jgi:hypothetical protein
MTVFIKTPFVPIRYIVSFSTLMEYSPSVFGLGFLEPIKRCHVLEQNLACENRLLPHWLREKSPIASLSHCPVFE